MKNCMFILHNTGKFTCNVKKSLPTYVLFVSIEFTEIKKISILTVGAEKNLAFPLKDFP